MGSYAEDYLKAKEKGKTEQVSMEIHSWDTEGQELIGKLIDVLPFEEGKFDTEVNKYIIDTDHGRVTTVLGAATDKRMANVKAGSSVYIKWIGKKALDGGKHVNIFEIESWK